MQRIKLKSDMDVELQDYKVIKMICSLCDLESLELEMTEEEIEQYNKELREKYATIH